jgi:ATP synthase F1 delta subunit
MIGVEYAKSLYETHSDTKVCLEEFKLLMNFYDELSPLLKSPGISKLEKHNIIDKTFKSLSKDFKCFLYVVIDNDRFNNLKEIYTEFVKLYNEANNIASCDCYSSNKLSEKEKKEIIKFLEKELKKEIELNEIVDASYIGIKIVYNNKTIDYTLEARINNMRLSI